MSQDSKTFQVNKLLVMSFRSSKLISNVCLTGMVSCKKTLPPPPPIYFTLKMEASCTSEMLILYHNATQNDNQQTSTWISIAVKARNLTWFQESHICFKVCRPQTEGLNVSGTQSAEEIDTRENGIKRKNHMKRRKIWDRQKRLNKMDGK
jgi:hypothetical protein